MPTTVPCPYCNAPVPVPDPPPADGRVACPRCEETVAIGATGPGTATPSAAPTAPPEPAAPPRPTNRAVAGIVIAVMLGMAAAGLAFALRTVEFRRANDVKGVQPPDQVPESRPVPPAEWAGLGYLPDDVQAVAGVRLAAALESPAGRALLAPLGLTPGDAGQGRVLGLAPGDVDHLLFGASLRALPPRVTTVVHTRPAQDADRLRKAIGSARAVEQHGRSLARGRLWANGPEGAVWRADGHTLVAALLPEDFDRIPAKPRAGVSRFAAPLSEVLADRLDPEALAWLAAAVDADTPAVGLLAGALRLPPAAGDAWGRLEAVAVGVRAAGPKLVLTAQVRCRDVAPGEAVAAAVAESLTKAGAAVTRRAGSRERPEEWQTLTATADADRVAAWLAGLRGK